MICYSGDESGLNLTIRDQPIFEDEDQAKQAMDDMANTLRLVGLLSDIVFRSGTDCHQASAEDWRQTECRHCTWSSRRSEHGVSSEQSAASRTRKPCFTFKHRSCFHPGLSRSAHKQACSFSEYRHRRSHSFRYYVGSLISHSA